MRHLSVGIVGGPCSAPFFASGPASVIEVASEFAFEF